MPAVRRNLTLPQAPQNHLLDRIAALELKQELVRYFEQHDILQWCGISDLGKIFGPSHGFGKGSKWPYAHPVVVGAGLIPQIDGQNRRLHHRIGLRLQSQHELKAGVREKISKHFDSVSDGLMSVRWTSRVTTLSGWAGSRKLNGGPASGAEINIAGGDSGAVAMLMRKEGNVHLLTAGHVVQNGRREVQMGDRLYSPVQDRVPGPHVAKVVEGALFPVYIPGDVYAGQTVDYALARIENGYVPSQAHIEDFVGNKISLPAAPTPQDWRPGEGPRVLKGPARTPHCGGRIEAIDVEVIVANPLSGTEYVGRDLIEVSLDKNQAVKPGDSGALLTLQTEAGHKPLAMVVAGALNSRLRGNKQNTMTSAVYALPLTAIPGIENWESP